MCTILDTVAMARLPESVRPVPHAGQFQRLPPHGLVPWGGSGAGRGRYYCTELLLKPCRAYSAHVGFTARCGTCPLNSSERLPRLTREVSTTNGAGNDELASGRSEEHRKRIFADWLLQG